MSKEELLTKALELLEKRKYSELRSELIDMEPIDIARLCDDLPEEKLPVVYRLLPKEQAAETFVELDPDIQELLIKSFSDNELHEVLKELYLDDTVDINRGNAGKRCAQDTQFLLAGGQKGHKRAAEIPAGQRGQHYDHGVCLP